MGRGRSGKLSEEAREAKSAVKKAREELKKAKAGLSAVTAQRKQAEKEYSAKLKEATRAEARERTEAATRTDGRIGNGANAESFRLDMEALKIQRRIKSLEAKERAARKSVDSAQGKYTEAQSKYENTRKRR